MNSRAAEAGRQKHRRAEMEKTGKAIRNNKNEHSNFRGEKSEGTV